MNLDFTTIIAHLMQYMYAVPITLMHICPTTLMKSIWMFTTIIAQHMQYAVPIINIIICNSGMCLLQTRITCATCKTYSDIKVENGE